MGVLVPKQRREMDEALAVAGFPLVTAGPLAPACRRKRIRWSAKAEQIKEHRFVVADPSAPDETAFRIQRSDAPLSARPWRSSGCACADMLAPMDQQLPVENQPRPELRPFPSAVWAPILPLLD